MVHGYDYLDNLSAHFTFGTLQARASRYSESHGLYGLLTRAASDEKKQYTAFLDLLLCEEQGVNLFWPVRRLLPCAVMSQF